MVQGDPVLLSCGPERSRTPLIWSREIPYSSHMVQRDSVLLSYGPERSRTPLTRDLTCITRLEFCRVAKDKDPIVTTYD